MLKPLNLCGYKIARTLPLAFDESLSYLEELSAILYKLNETIEQTNKNTEVAEEYESYLNEIKQEVGRLEVEFEEFKISVNQDIDNKLALLTGQLYNYIQNQFDILEYNLNIRFNNIQKQIDDIIAGDITIHDPTTGLESPIQVVIDNIYDMNRNNAITCTEFDGIELTATEFDAIEITAFNFDINGKELLNL